MKRNIFDRDGKNAIETDDSEPNYVTEPGVKSRKEGSNNSNNNSWLKRARSLETLPRLEAALPSFKPRTTDVSNEVPNLGPVDKQLPSISMDRDAQNAVWPLFTEATILASPIKKSQSELSIQKENLEDEASRILYAEDDISASKDHRSAEGKSSKSPDEQNIVQANIRYRNQMGRDLAIRLASEILHDFGQHSSTLCVKISVSNLEILRLSTSIEIAELGIVEFLEWKR